jgi:hypothetical protein
VFSRQLEHGDFFHIIGDFDSRELAESFMMYKNLKKYQEGKSASQNNEKKS